MSSIEQIQMVRKFFKWNKKAIQTVFLWMSLILTSLVLFAFTYAYLKGQKPEWRLITSVVLLAGIVLPILISIIAFLRWWWGFTITNRNFSSFPFAQLNSIGFNKALKNEASKTKFVSEYYTGRINDFIVDCDVDTQYENKLLTFKYYVNVKPLGKTEYIRIQKEFDLVNGILDIYWISKKYHYKNHHLNSVDELQMELVRFGKMIQKENIQPSEFPNRL